MAAITNLARCSHGGSSLNFGERRLTFQSTPALKTRISWPSKNPLAVGYLGKGHKNSGVRMALVDEKLARSGDLPKPSDILAFDLVQGALVKWSSVTDRSLPDPPTAVFLHGILGCRKNWGTFTRRLAQEFPTWQFLLVDLRCHGDSASIKKRGPHTVSSTALDVLKLVRQLRITPRVLVGHSFGGKGSSVNLAHYIPFAESASTTVNPHLLKMDLIRIMLSNCHVVALSMVEQAAKPLARPVRVWVLDATPGKVRPGGDGEEHPEELISVLSTLPQEVSSKRDVVDVLVRKGFSKDVAQ